MPRNKPDDLSPERAQEIAEECYGAERARLEVTLARHYASRRAAACPEVVSALASAMLAEDARAHRGRPRRMGAAEFVASRVNHPSTRRFTR